MLSKKNIIDGKKYLKELRSEKQKQYNMCFNNYIDVDEVEVDQELAEIQAVDELIIENENSSITNFRDFIVDMFSVTQNTIEVLNKILTVENVQEMKYLLVFNDIKLEVIGEIIRDF